MRAYPWHTGYLEFVSDLFGASESRPIFCFFLIDGMGYLHLLFWSDPLSDGTLKSHENLSTVSRTGALFRLANHPSRDPLISGSAPCFASLSSSLRYTLSALWMFLVFWNYFLTCGSIMTGHQGGPKEPIDSECFFARHLLLRGKSPYSNEQHGGYWTCNFSPHLARGYLSCPQILLAIIHVFRMSIDPLIDFFISMHPKLLSKVKKLL